MKLRILHIVALVLLLATATSSHAADAKTTARAAWDEGIAAYERKEYAKAVEAFENIASLGEVSDDLYYNLANAYFKLGQQPDAVRHFADGELGRAVLNYHRALRLNPAMEDARYNLEIAVDHTNDTDGVPQSFIVTLWHALRNAMTANGWTVLSLVVLASLLTLTMVYLLSERITLRKVCFFTSLVLCVCLILSTTLAASSHYAIKNDTRAVVLCHDTTPVHASPDSASKIIRQPSQGVTVRIARSHGEWSEIIFADGEKGWIRSAIIERI